MDSFEGLLRHLKSGFTTNLSSIERIPVFLPMSGHHRKIPELGFQSANNFPSQLLMLLKALEKLGAHSMAAVDGRLAIGPVNEMEPTSMDEFEGSLNVPIELVSGVFQSLGCSKVAFSRVYSYMLGRVYASAEVPRILEIGIGTNNEAAISTMGKHYSPGASLRSYKALLENAQIFGVDFDSSCLFSEERIETAFGDQTKLDTLMRLKSKFGSDFDLVIDDGLHSTEANLNSLIFGIQVLAAKGIIYIEDISPKALEIWKLVGIIMGSHGFTTRIIRQNSSGLGFLAEKN